MLNFQDWLKIQIQSLEDQVGEAPVNVPQGEQPEPSETEPIEEDKISVDVDVDGGDDVEESRPYTRSLRFYPGVTPPTGGGPNFQYIAQDAQAMANAKKQGVKMPKTVSPKGHSGMEDEKVKARVKDWATLSGLRMVDGK